jgi:AraC-like DNA-binding protein
VDRDDPNERIVLRRPLALLGMEVMAGYGCTQPFHYFHQRYAFTACVSVDSGVRYRGRNDRLVDRCVMVLEPGETHYNTFVAKPAEFKVCFVDPQVLADHARELGCLHTLHFPAAPISSNPGLFPILHQLCAAMEHGQDALRQQSLFVACLSAFARHAGNSTGVPGNGGLAIERAKAHLRERFEHTVTLNELASISRLSQFHLVHLFTRYVGLPPHAYQVHVRVERARALLQQGMQPAQVAASVGFVDQSHFTRHFKRVMRVTPSQYARASGSARRRKLTPGSTAANPRT